MKTKLIKQGVLLAVLLLAATGAHAWQFEIDNTQNDLVFEVWFNTQGDTVQLDGYGLDFGFDATEMAWSGDYTNTAPAPLFADLLGPASANGTGSISNFNAASFGAGPTFGPDTRLLLGTLGFDLLNPDTSLQDGAPDVWFDLASQNLIVTLDVNGAGLAEYSAAAGNFQFALGPDLDIGNPVPVPAAVWLFGSGLLGLIGLRRRKR